LISVQLPLNRVFYLILVGITENRP
jgi:hypothetical protein